ncbi:hypothetical protein BVG80_12060 [Sphingobacteriales bacterium TSM_CSM]|nr:hypothetical protein BVG80_12060 [Sphingobacteriales bacterium TSM_CSM]
MSYIADKPNIALRINYVHKLNAQHQTEWIIDAYCRGGGGPSLIQLADSSYFVAGSYYLDDGLYNKNAEILKLSPLGELLWRRQFGGNGDDYVYDAIVQDHDYSGRSGYVLCGRTESNLPPGRADAWLVRLNCMGLLTVPQAAFMAIPFPAMPQTIAFANQSQYVYPDSIDGGHYILDWGDGSPPYLCGQGYSPCSENTIPHTYQTEGIYGVTLQAIVCNDTSTLTRAVCIDFAPNPQAAFTYTDFGGMVQFTNLSQNSYLAQGGYFSWDFGDGSPPVYDANPAHTYTDNDNFTVTLTLIVCQDTSVYMQFVQVQTVGMPQTPPRFEGGQGGEQVVVYPNPAQNTLQISRSLSEVETSFSLYTPAGQLVLQTPLVSTSSTTAAGSTTANTTTHTLSVAHLPAGIYFYVVSGIVGEDSDNGDNGGSMVLARGKVAVVR